MHYPARLRYDGEDWLVFIRDIEGGFTYSSVKEKALAKAPGSLLRAIARHVDERRPVLLLNEMLASGLSSSALARKVGTTPQEMSRITNLFHATKIDTLEQVLEVLGKRVEIRVV